MSYVETVQGSADSDNYQFNLGDGELVIDEVSNNPGAEDVLRFGEGILPWELEVRRQGLDLHLVHINGTDSVVVRNWFSSTDASATFSTDSTLERIEFFDGWLWTPSDIALLGVTSRGSEAADRLSGWSGNDHMFGEGGNDVLDAGAGSNRLYGGAGNDVLKVSATATYNSLEGGTGNDTLIGSHNSDTYVFNLGDGVDVIKELGSNTDAVDTLFLGPDITPGDIELRKVGQNLEIVHHNGADKVVVSNWFSSTGSAAAFSTTSTLERIMFANPGSEWPQQQEWTLQNIAEMGVVSRGSEGDDTLMGWSGNDHMFGEAGNDVLDAGSGRNDLYGGAGDDLLKVSTAAADNYFEGGAGNDTLIGSHNNDTYVFGVGSGVDVIKESGNNSGAEDVLLLDSSIYEPWDIELRKVGQNLEIVHSNGTDKMVVSNWFTSTGSAAGFSTTSTLERIVFTNSGSDWTQQREWTLQNIAEMGVVSRGSEGDDTLRGWLGNDHMFGEAGNDLLDAGSGRNSLFGGDGDDLLKVSTAAADNYFEGGAGNDTLIGSHNNDTYVFGVGSGVDVIKESGNNSGAEDVLLLDSSIYEPWDIELRKVGQNLEIVHSNGTDKMVVSNWFTSTGSAAGFSTTSTLERIVFTNSGSDWTQQREWTLQNIAEMGVVSRGSEGDDTLRGWLGNDHMHGEDGNDVLDAGSGRNALFGGEGNDLLKVSAAATDNYFEGGAGNDTLIGSRNSDTYVFDAGSAVDVIKELGSNSGTVDYIQFGAGIDEGDLWFERSANDLVIRSLDGSDQVSIADWYSRTSAKVEVIQLVDGKQLLESQVQSLVDAMASFGVAPGETVSLSAGQQQQLDMVLAANWV
ncbi:hypothetical protein HNE05_14870 [Aquipseudomonas campi]|uniref:Haemolysin-type calcium binding-related domain-containing protein n=1 Tax=Aquipseudomonas campi TaxID=2731681 RepID=A0A6M8F775_9GAMM|nr:calcium-binding protein [Pseudomonas campi]QKE64574.1 hypothetical protein HNE05_14870 [Pseudomonas campi]